ncbi:MAG: hypothetical protein IK069_01915 [Firmicutes bacterium]|nr:hypothetical protein [Bacillota bacterium]
MKSRARIGDLIIAIIAGVALWAYVVSVLDPIGSATIRAVPVQLLNESSIETSGLAIAGSGEYTVDVTVSGTRSNISAVSAADFVATADVSDLHKGQNYINVEVQAPSNLSVTEVRTQSIQVYVDTLVSETRPLHIILDNNAENRELGNIKVNASDFKVSGAQNLVENVVAIEARLDAAGLEPDTEFTNTLNLRPVDSEGNSVIGVKLSESTVDITASLYATKEVALNVPVNREFDSNVKLLSELIPSSVVIKGPSAQLAEIWSVETKSIDREAITESCTIILEPRLPDGIELADVSQGIAAVYEMLGRISESVTFTPETTVYFINVPEGVSPVLLENISVVYSVYEDAKGQVGTDDFVVTIDMAGYSGGTHSLPVTVTAVSRIEGVEIVSYTENVSVEYTGGTV